MAEIVRMGADEDEDAFRGGRHWRTVAEKRRIVEQTLLAGASVSAVVREHGINANHVFQWRRQYRAGGLSGDAASATQLLPVLIAQLDEAVTAEEFSTFSGASIHIEFPSRALVTIKAGVNPALARAVIERLAR